MKAMTPLTLIILSATGFFLFAGNQEARADVRVSVNFGSGYHSSYSSGYHYPRYYRTRTCAPRHYHYAPRRVYYSRPSYHYRPRYVIGYQNHYRCTPQRVIYRCR
jgi:hypothetical protein